MLEKILYSKESYLIKEACIEIKNKLGCGFLEKVYENALKYELESKGFKVRQQETINVIYKDKIVGEYKADLIVDNKIIEMLEDYGLAQAMKSSETENIYYSKDEDLELLKND